jgi:hypothetical protein
MAEKGNFFFVTIREMVKNHLICHFCMLQVVGFSRDFLQRSSGNNNNIVRKNKFIYFQFLTYFITVSLGNGASDICQFHRKLEETIFQFMHNLLIA